MSPVLKQLTEVAVRLQTESIRIRNIMGSIPEHAWKKCYNSIFSDMQDELNSASVSVTELVFELYCAEDKPAKK